MADTPQGITKITVQGFKSLYDETAVEIRPLTLLAGANSSGKSSIMQPLLLMKQTLEAEYEPNVFRMDGPNVHFTDDRQFLSGPYDINTQDDKAFFLTVTIEMEGENVFQTFYTKPKEYEAAALEIWRTTFKRGEKNFTLHRSLTNEKIINIVGEEIDELRKTTAAFNQSDLRWRVVPDRSFLSLAIYSSDDSLIMNLSQLPLKIFPIWALKREIQNILHVPGLRGNPQRSYPSTTTGIRYEGTFEPYTASLIHHWARSRANELVRLLEQVRLLGLTSHVTAESINQAQLQILVARTDDIDDMVSIADVGFGVSQVLPVLVALLVAKPGQLVYLEQPELHLHPRAQTKLAEIIADAAKRGVRVVVETHSSLLLLGIQTLIAENKLNHEDVILHWFKRGEDGKTTVTSVEPDENGAYGEWPEDFADVELDAQSRYMEAVEKRLLEQQN